MPRTCSSNTNWQAASVAHAKAARLDTARQTSTFKAGSNNHCLHMGTANRSCPPECHTHTPPDVYTASHATDYGCCVLAEDMREAQNIVKRHGSAAHGSGSRSNTCATPNNQVMPTPGCNGKGEGPMTENQNLPGHLCRVIHTHPCAAPVPSRPPPTTHPTNSPMNPYPCTPVTHHPDVVTKAHSLAASSNSTHSGAGPHAPRVTCVIPPCRSSVLRA